MWAVRKNPPDLSTEQPSSMAEIATTNKMLYRAYLLKEQLREVFRAKAAGRVAVVGLALRYPGVRHPRRQHPTLPRSHPRHPRPRVAQRPI